MSPESRSNSDEHTGFGAESDAKWSRKDTEAKVSRLFPCGPFSLLARSFPPRRRRRRSAISQNENTASVKLLIPKIEPALTDVSSARPGREVSFAFLFRPIPAMIFYAAAAVGAASRAFRKYYADINKYALSQHPNAQFRIKHTHAPFRAEIIINNYQRLEMDISANVATSRAQKLVNAPDFWRNINAIRRSLREK